MLFLLDMLVMAAVSAQSLALHNVERITAPARGEIIAVDYGREYWRDDGRSKCLFKGYMTGFDRDWEEVENKGMDTEAIKPPDAGVTQGQALIFTQRVCNDRPIERMLRVGEHSYLKDSELMYDGKVSPTYSVYEVETDELPKWLPAVLTKVETRSANGDPIAQQMESEMLEYANEYMTAKQAAEQAKSAANPN